MESSGVYILFIYVHENMELCNLEKMRTTVSRLYHIFRTQLSTVFYDVLFKGN